MKNPSTVKNPPPPNRTPAEAAIDRAHAAGVGRPVKPQGGNS
jgi:hypothetical protein